MVPLLQYNVRQHANVYIHPFGASSRDETVVAFVPAVNVGGGRIANDETNRSEEGVKFQVRRLDDVPEISALAAIDFIKIDIEGHELDAIDGMSAILKQHQPLIAFEQNTNQVHEGSTATIERLRGLGYTHLYDIRSGRSRIPRSLPRFLRLPLKFIESGFRDPFLNAEVLPISILQPREYPMLLASASALAGTLPKRFSRPISDAKQ
jgi:FkbM family methyltransferase